MTVEPYLALLVWKTRRPVRMVWERQESLLARQKRHPFRMTLPDRRDERRHDRRAGHPDHRRRRRVPAAQLAGAVRRRRSTRPGRTAAPTRGWRAWRCSPTPCRPARCEGSARCRSCSATSRRWTGSPSCSGLDRAEVRERNFVELGDHRGDRRGDRHPARRARVHAPRAAGARPNRRRRPTAASVGQGFACSMQPYGRSVFFADRASCWIGLEQDGTMIVRAGVTDLGAGQAASLVDIAGEILGVTADRASVHIGDTALTPLTGGTFATRQLYMSGNATLKVARELRDKLAPVAADLLGCRARAARVRRQQGGGRRASPIGRFRSRRAVADCGGPQRDALLPQHVPRRDGRVRSLDRSRALVPRLHLRLPRGRSRGQRGHRRGQDRQVRRLPRHRPGDRHAAGRWARSRARSRRASATRSARTSRSTTA